jgi:RNA polymerase sigma-70 factor (ECF subfamily)
MDAEDADDSGLDRLRARFEAVAIPLLSVVYRAALRFTREPDAARDITQETFLRAFRTFDRFEPGTNCKAWLLTIVYSVFVNRARRQQREPVVAVDDVELVREASYASAPAGPPASALTDRISDPQIEAALNGLPEAFRSAILLVDVEELTYEEAAGVLACPVNTLRTRLFRGRKLLWVALREYASGQGYSAGDASRGRS